MREIVALIKEQQSVNFQNVREQIQRADVGAVFDAESNSRYIFHYLHSLDRFFAGPAGYVYEGGRLFGIPEELSVIDPARDGYVRDPSLVIPRERLLAYLGHVEERTNRYLDGLSDDDLLLRPEGSEYTRFELVLAQFRHLMWHVGLSSAITFSSTGEWNAFTGLSAMNARLFGGGR